MLLIELQRSIGWLVVVVGRMHYKENNPVDDLHYVEIVADDRTLDDPIGHVENGLGHQRLAKYGENIQF